MEIFKDTTFVTTIKSLCLQELQRSALFCYKTDVCLSLVMYSVMPRPRRALECNGGLVLELGQVYVDDCRSAHTLEHSTPQEDSNMWIVNW
jgi:hypothetical protein